ncbi:MAG: hypothetical protein AB1631_03540 [Acidobacteriota bacterium]
MGDEKIERQIAFIIDNQAKFSADMVRLEAQTKENAEHIGNLADALMSLTNIVEKQNSKSPISSSKIKKPAIA